VGGLINAEYAVLRSWCLSVDEPVRGSTPARAILGTLVTPTPKHWLISGVDSAINIKLSYFWTLCIYTLSLAGSFLLWLWALRFGSYSWLYWLEFLED
jgi:hypothetical protein